MRVLLLALFVFGSLGLAAELTLIEHVEDIEQWIPLVLLGLGLLTAALHQMRPTSFSLRVFRATMLLFIAAGALGFYYHFIGNVEFALERDPSLRGLALAWKSLGGATPTLAPGALAQLGLLGLIATLRDTPAHAAGVPRNEARE